MNIRIFEGILLMADFRDANMRCRIHPAWGDPVMCAFDKTQQASILRALLHSVRVVGESLEESVEDETPRFVIRNIERLSEPGSIEEPLKVQETSAYRNFWDPPTLDEIVAMQGDDLLTDLDEIKGKWPGDIDDGFEEWVRAERAGSIGR